MEQRKESTAADREYQQMVRAKADVLKAIANPIRLCLVKKLKEHGECNVTYFTDCMDTSQPNISQHLAKLRDLGIVGCRKDGQTVNYYLTDETVSALISVLFPE